MPDSQLQAVDTNILLRYVVRDHEEQYRKARPIIEEEGCFILESVVLELMWALEGPFKMDVSDAVRGARALFGLPTVEVENPHGVNRALQWHLDGMDFGDAMHRVKAKGRRQLLTFDKDFVELSKTRPGCPVNHPSPE
jgi:predicted nucleic-acid-binding protein